jgi:hypothetical protein
MRPVKAGNQSMEAVCRSGDTPQHHLRLHSRGLGVAPEGIAILDGPPRDPSPPPQPPPSAAPQGPVTRLSKVAGVIVVLVGLVLTALGAFLVWVFHDGFSSGSGIRFIALLGVGILVIGPPALLAGIGILRGKDWGRIIGIVYSLLLVVLSLFFPLSIDIDVPIFALSAYTLIVLIARWREPVTT